MVFREVEAKYNKKPNWGQSITLVEFIPNQLY